MRIELFTGIKLHKGTQNVNREHKNVKEEQGGIMKGQTDRRYKTNNNITGQTPKTKRDKLE